MKLHTGRMQQTPKLWLTLILVACGLLATGSLLSAQETEPTAVDLISFSVTQQFGSDELLIRWETAEEIGTAGYRLERDDTPITVDYEAPPNGSRTLVNIVPAIGLTANGSGGVYVAYDSGPFTQNATYEYTLVEIETDNTEIAIDDFEITIDGGPTATPENSSVGNNSTATPLPTNTPRATSTPQSTTPSNNGQATATPTPRTNSANPTVTPSASNPTATLEAVPPTNNSGPGQSDPPESDSEEIAAVGVVEASESPQQDDPYPQPEPESEDVGAPTNSEETYPAGTPETEPRFQITDEDGNPVQDTSDPAYTPPDGASAIGTGSGTETDASQPLGDQNTSNAAAEGRGESQTTLVWGAFIAALLIFVASVIGAIILFSRRTQSAASSN